MSERAILGALVAAAAVLTWRGVRTGNLSPRTYAGLAVVAFMLLALASFSPELAGALAVLVLVVLLLASQEDIQSLVNIGGKVAK